MSTSCRWSGAFEVRQDSFVVALAHGQLMKWCGAPLPEDSRVMGYGLKAIVEGVVTLYSSESSHLVVLPDILSPLEIKEACAGLGCIGLAGELLGMKKPSCLDIH